MLPPAPESGSAPIDRLNIPTGVPSLKVPDIEIALVALMVMFPPCPLLLVLLLIWAPLPITSEFVVIEIFPALPQGPEQFSLPTVAENTPLGARGLMSQIVPSRTPGSGNSPEIEIVPALIVTFPPLPLLAVAAVIRLPTVISSFGVVTTILPEFPLLPKSPKELL